VAHHPLRKRGAMRWIVSILNFLVGMKAFSGFRFKITLHRPPGFGTKKIFDQKPDEGCFTLSTACFSRRLEISSSKVSLASWLAGIGV
jgi:hypothetical protein